VLPLLAFLWASVYNAGMGATRLFCSILLLLLPSFSLASAPSAHDVLDYTLDVSFDIKASTIHGIAKIAAAQGQALAIARGSLTFNSVSLGGVEVPFSTDQDMVRIYPRQEGVLEIRYEGRFNELPRGGQPSDVISHKGIFLSGTWYPKPYQMCRYHLMATLPKEFEAVSEGERIEKTVRGAIAVFSFDFPHPLDGISLIAADRYKIKKSQFAGVEIFAYFFPEDADLMDTYLEKTKYYLGMYDSLIGHFPYKRFSVVENFLPTGYSMPTYTLLGQQIVRLPFIPQTSLGHEILHQWLGNLVYIDYGKGNWAEGLTTFLADHLYQEKEGRGPEYRKAALVGYTSYVNHENEFPLKDFRERTDQASEAIGYGKGLMVFQMLKSLVGEERFYASIRDFVEDVRFRKASWADIKRAFERHYQPDLTLFFNQWVDEKGLPELRIDAVELRPSEKGLTVAFDVLQGNKSYVLDVPVSVYLHQGKVNRSLHLSQNKDRFTILTGGLPHRIILDEHYEVARSLSLPEFPPVIARLAGDEKRLIVANPSKAEIYESIIEAFKGSESRVIDPDRMTHEDLKRNSVVILGADNPVIARLYGAVAGKGGFSVTVKENPWNPRKVAGILDGRSKDEVEAAFPKITHYGKYSFLSFDHGVNVAKTTDDTTNGVVQSISRIPTGVDISGLQRWPAIIDRVVDRRIIYIGEAHDRYSHHIMELEIIRHLHEKGKKIAIGMEMFQRPFQKMVDDYVEGRIDEKAFLKGTEYFKRWGFDYQLYRPILLFARVERIPVIALNQRQEIVGKVFRSGLESLSDQERPSLPAQMDFSDVAYRERLKKVFQAHEGFQPGQLDFFYQAQVLWDETMAESVDQFLRAHPDHQMVVLAGAEHLAFGSGIPKRTARRGGSDYVIVLNDADMEPGVADFVLFPETIPGGTAPLLMVHLKEEAGRVVVEGFPHHSVSEKAGIKTGDAILSIGETPIHAIEDLKIELLAHAKGDRVNVRVLRKGFFGGTEMDFHLELQ
jgi:aminopeptidase N